MNQKIHYVLHAVSFTAIALLFFMHFNQRSSAAVNASGAVLPLEEDVVDESMSYDVVDTSANAKAGFAMRIVYVNADSILTRFDYYKKLRASMEAKAKRSEAELEGEARKLEAEYADAQKKAQGMSQEQLAFVEQGLMRKQQNIMMLRENLAKELADEEEKLDKLLREKVQAYFKRLSKAEGYDYVLSYHYGSNVVYGDKSHDITARVVQDLNREYAAESKVKRQK